MVGPAGSGKTSLLSGEVITAIPTHGFNMKTLTIEGTKFTLWELAGSWFQRVALWSRHTDGIAAMVFVVDSTDLFQIEQTKTVMWTYYSDYDTIGEKGVMLLFANKQDCQGAMSVTDMKDYLELETRAEGRRWHIRGSVATTAEGVVEGFIWTFAQINGARPIPVE